MKAITFIAVVAVILLAFLPNPAHAQDTDGDGIPDASDPCLAFPNTLPINDPTAAPGSPNADENGDGIPNECQCQDFDDDGYISNGDVLFLFCCIPGGLACPAQCDDKLASGKVGSAGTPPSYSGVVVGDTFVTLPGQSNAGNFFSLTCLNRPEGTPPP